MGILRFLKLKIPSRSRPSSPSAPKPRGGELEQVFKKLDSNSDGKISASELADFLASLGNAVSDDEIRTMMAEADGDGFISLDEFVDLNSGKVDPAAAVEDLRQAFSVYDLDGNGSISAEELASVLRSLGEAASVGQCRKMIAGVDRNGDGQICFEEFKAMMFSSPFAAAVASAAVGED